MIGQAMIELTKKRWYFFRVKEVSDFVPWDEIDSIVSVPIRSVDLSDLFKKVSTGVKVVLDKDKHANKRKTAQSYIIKNGQEGTSVAELLINLGVKPDYIISLHGPTLDVFDYTGIPDEVYQTELAKAFGHKVKKCCAGGNCGTEKCGCSKK